MNGAKLVYEICRPLRGLNHPLASDPGADAPGFMPSRALRALSPCVVMPHTKRKLSMNRLFSSIFIALLCSVSLHAQGSADVADLEKLLNDFLAGASRNDVEMHERFWAEDLIYTGATGRRVGKADIMKDVRNSPALKAGERTTYSAEEIRIEQFYDTAIVAFRLIAKVERGDKVEISRFLNTGTFLKRKGKWQAVSWQATRLPRSGTEDPTGIVGAEQLFTRRC